MSRAIIFLCLLLSIACKTKTKPKVILQNSDTPINYNQIKKLPVAALYDIKLELDFIRVANENKMRFVISEVIISSPRWSSTFNKMGHITARSRNASIIAIANDKCYLQNVIFQQKGDGQKFEETKIVAEDGWNSFDCSLLENKNPNDIIAGVSIKN